MLVVCVPNKPAGTAQTIRRLSRHRYNMQYMQYGDTRVEKAVLTYNRGTMWRELVDHRKLDL